MARNPTDYTTEFFGFEFTPTGATDSQHATNLDVGPGLTKTFNQGTGTCTISKSASFPQQLANAKCATTDVIGSTTGGLYWPQYVGTYGSDLYSSVEGDRILVWQQTNPSENGIYKVSGGILVRDPDVYAPGSTIFVENGAILEGKTFQYMKTNVWRPMQGPDRCSFVFMSPSSAGWVTLLAIPLQGSASYFLDVAIAAVFNNQQSGNKRSIRTSATWLEGATPTLLGDPLFFGPPGEADAGKQLRYTISQYALNVQGYQSTTDTSTYRIECSYQERTSG